VETGAGKSILVEALGLALGERASSRVVRDGCERAEVTAVFDISTIERVQEQLEIQELSDGEQECILRRSVNVDGRSRAYVNGRPVPLQLLRRLGELLVDIQGQTAHHSLLKRATQCEIVDNYAGHHSTLAEIATLHERWRRLSRELEDEELVEETTPEQLDYLRHQLRELRELALGEGELEKLNEEHTRCAHAKELLEGCRGILAQIGTDSEIGILSATTAIVRGLESLQTHDSRLSNIRCLLETSEIHLKEADSELRDYIDGLELDPHRLEWLEHKISKIHGLSRKHNVDAAVLPTLEQQFESRIDTLESREQRISLVREQLEELRDNYRSLATGLHRSRSTAALNLAKDIAADIRKLGMPGSEFKIFIECDEELRPSPFGSDRVDFQVTTNPGQPLQPLARVASGGELSRISLAIHVLGAGASGVPTLIFDEVDSGIGGRVAELVGQKLRGLGKSRQVLCITHLPQVASQGHNHYQVQKVAGSDQTTTDVVSLSRALRIKEVARMLGGLDITERTIAHAKEMLDCATR
jgi:DNA repair protein RecN (Recombination protein N)